MNCLSVFDHFGGLALKGLTKWLSDGIASYLISNPDESQSLPSWQTSDTPLVGYKSAENLVFDSVGRSCALVITVALLRHSYLDYDVFTYFFLGYDAFRFCNARR